VANGSFPVHFQYTPTFRHNIIVRTISTQRAFSQQEDKFNYYLAMHFYLSGTAFYRVQEPFLLKAFDVLRPGAGRPTRQTLAGPLLDLCYERVLSEVTNFLKGLPKTQ